VKRSVGFSRRIPVQVWEITNIMHFPHGPSKDGQPGTMSMSLKPGASAHCKCDQILRSSLS
jgi:hypothetical protein